MLKSTSLLSLLGCLAGLALLTWGCTRIMTNSSASPASTPAPGSAPGAGGAPAGPSVTVRLLDERGQLTEPLSVAKIVKSDAEWQAQLSAEQFRIARNQGTERAFCGLLNDNKAAGLYSCVCCGLPLFSSEHKFESGSGWPSYFQPVAAENVTEKPDRSHGMLRVEITCARCDAHLGHVFDDGPPPTGQRHCLNSESLVFTPKERLATEPELAHARATAIFAAGCFWGVEETFRQTPGVLETAVGYTGGKVAEPTYKQVCAGNTGHAEAVRVIYDPSRVSYSQLLAIFFANHDPTQLNRQGPDFGTQYRGGIFYRGEEQRLLAQAAKEALSASGRYARPIVTEIVPEAPFWMAEEYHQQYLAKQGLANCHVPETGQTH
ncbi:MAG: bifunctional methionine sulfoxide reductase B/A protein [Planctomycetota bacterium]